MRDTLELRLGAPYIAKIRQLWENSVRQAFEAMLDLEWQHESTVAGEDIFLD